MIQFAQSRNHKLRHNEIRFLLIIFKENII